MYKNNEIPSNFNKIAEISDNFVVWVKDTTLVNNRDYEAYIQYITPSTWLLHTTNYRIKNGTSYTYDANYINNGMYNYLDSYDLKYSLNTITIDDDYINDSDYNRGDFLPIFIVQFIIVVIFVWVFGHLSRIFFKGGLK